jgi:hypothetical protein
LRTRLIAYKLSGDVQSFLLGPHAPTLTREDLDLIHRIWLDAVAEVGIEVHHRDVVRVALERLRRELASGKRRDALDLIRRQSRETSSLGSETPAIPRPGVEARDAEPERRPLGGDVGC